MLFSCNNDSLLPSAYMLYRQHVHNNGNCFSHQSRPATNNGAKKITKWKKFQFYSLLLLWRKREEKEQQIKFEKCRMDKHKNRIAETLDWTRKRGKLKAAHLVPFHHGRILLSGCCGDGQRERKKEMRIFTVWYEKKLKRRDGQRL